MAARAIVQWTIVLLSALVLVGIAVRRRHRVCWTFTLYVAAVMISDALILRFPRHFLNAPFWLFKEGLCNVLCVGVAVETAARTFAGFPTARRTTMRLFALIGLVTTATIVASFDPSLTTTKWLAGRVYPRVMNGTTVLFAALTACVIWYQVPLHPFRRAILLGLGPYLFVFTTLLAVLDAYGWSLRDQINAVNPIAYLTLVAFWVYSAWRPRQARLVVQAVPAAARSNP